MVKYLFKFMLILHFSFAFCFLTGCNVDLLGFFAANDLDERLQSRNDFVFLSDEDRNWTTPLGDTYQFIVLSDTHIEDGNAFNLEKLADVTAGNTEIKFAVITGDITQYGGERDVRKFIEIANSLGVPCYPVVGNHDIYFRNRDEKKGWNVWKNEIGSTNYRINAGSATIIILDTANSFFGKDQLDWLEREIKTGSSRVFVFSHSPLFVKGPADMQQMTDTKELARVLSILKNRCDIMFMGHLHKHMENEAGNVRYISLASYIDDREYYLVNVTQAGVTFERKKL